MGWTNGSACHRLTHVATVTFLASRAAPSLQFFLALGGGMGLARVAHDDGGRRGYGAALAAMLQTVAVMGPARINAPITQAITAPAMGALQARGARPVTEWLACLALRLVHYAVAARAVHLRDPRRARRVHGSYEKLTGWIGIVPQGAGAALAVTAAGQPCGRSSTAPCRWRPTGARCAPGRARADAGATLRAAAPPPRRHPPPRAGRGRFDPRAVVLAALLATALLLASTAWLLLIGVIAWLVPAWLLSRPDHDAVPLGLVLAGLLAFAALTGGLLGGAASS